MKTAKRTDAQISRDAAKDASGRYKRNKCERCAEPAPMDYYSAGDFVVLCRACCAAVEAAEIAFTPKS